MSDDISPEVKAFLADLSRDDINTLRASLPVIRKVLGFGQVARWLAIASLSLLAGIVLLGESVAKIISWLRQAAGNG